MSRREILDDPDRQEEEQIASKRLRREKVAVRDMLNAVKKKYIEETGYYSHSLLFLKMLEKEKVIPDNPDPPSLGGLRRKRRKNRNDKPLLTDPEKTTITL